MNLVADIGNTRSKFAIFHADELVRNQSYDKSADIEDFKHFINLNTGRFSGNCYIVFLDRRSSLTALYKRNYMYIRNRYVEMFKDAGDQ